MSTVTQNRQAQTPIGWLAAPAALVIVGLATWVFQLQNGMAVTGISQGVVWGLYIAAFFVLAGTACGCLLLAALGDLGFVPALAKYRQSLSIAALAGYVGAGVVILMDIGHPERVFSFLTSPQFGSPFVWDFYALALGALLSLVYFFYSPKWLSWLAILAAVAVVVAEGLLMSVIAARPLWDSPLTPIVFLVEAAISSAAVVALLFGDQKVRKLMVTILRLAATGFLIMLFVEAVSAMWGGATEGKAAMTQLLSGGLASLFWVEVIGLLLVIVLPLIGSGTSVLAATSVIALLSVVLAKLNLLVIGQSYRLDGSLSSYAPSWVEVGGVLGAIGLAALIYLAGRRWIPSRS